MKKEQTKIDAERYEAPQMKVKELRQRSVICASQFGLEDGGEFGDGGNL